MKIEAYLVINRGSSIRVVKQRPNLSNDEIAIKLNLEIPQEFFERIIPSVDILVPIDSMIKPDIEVVTRINAEMISKAMNLNVNDVQDGLKEMLEKQEKDQDNG
jgi:hypothetical protein